jgi:hypothetical protein
MLQKIRRVVTGHNAAGKAVILFDDHAPNVNPLKGWPGAGVTEIWVTDEMPVSNLGSTDRSLRPMRHDPTPSGTIFRVVEIPPERAVDQGPRGAAHGGNQIVCQLRPPLARSGTISTRRARVV